MTQSLIYPSSFILELARQLVDETHGQADDVPVVSFDAFDEERGAALHGVGSRLVEHVAGPDVPGDLLFRRLREAHARPLDADDCAPRLRAHERHAGQDLMPAPAQTPQHAVRVLLVARLLQNLSAYDDRRVRAEHEAEQALRG